MTVMFRSDKFYGYGGYSPEEVLAYECLNLGKVYVLEDLLTQVKKHLSDVELSDINWLLAAIKNGNIKVNDNTMNYNSYVCVFTFIVNALEKELGMRINYLMWLGDMETILDNYSQEHTDYLKEFDAYETGTLIYKISDEGSLFAYQERPKPLSKNVVKEALDNTKGLYKVYVYPGVGYELQEIYFNHCNISVEEIAAYCVNNNCGYYCSCSELTQEALNDLKNNDRYVYVDLSEYHHKDGIFLLIENLKTGDGVEIY